MIELRATQNRAANEVSPYSWTKLWLDENATMKKSVAKNAEIPEPQFLKRTRHRLITAVD